jgi:putative oxidoreductase
MSQANKVVDFIARLFLVFIFPFSALDKIFNHQSAMAQAGHGSIALPPSLAALLLVLGGMLEVLGPICILLDFYRRQAALLFVFYVIVTAVLFHNSGASRSTATNGLRTSGPSSRISGSPAAFSTWLVARR